MRGLKFSAIAGALLVTVAVSAPSQAAVSGAAAARENQRHVVHAAPATHIRRLASPHVSAGAPGQFTSRNWDGYVSLTGGATTSFRSVTSTWVQPTVTCPTADAWAVFWVGLDGWNSNTVEQGGTSARCVNGVPQYKTWWEMYPTNAITTVNTIKAGDKVKATVTYLPATKTYRIVVKDLTSGKGFTQMQQCASNLTCNNVSSEVIAEDVGRFGQDNYFPLANYGTMTFTGSSETNQAGTVGAFTSPAWENDAVTESSGGITYATVSALSNAGKNFKAIWHHQ